MKSSQSLPDIYQTYPKSGHTFGGHTPIPWMHRGLYKYTHQVFSVGFFVCGRMGTLRLELTVEEQAKWPHYIEARRLSG